MTNLSAFKSRSSHKSNAGKNLCSALALCHVLLTGCSVLLPPQPQAQRYDLSSAASTNAATTSASAAADNATPFSGKLLPLLLVADVMVDPSLSTDAMVYRLTYDDVRRPRVYAQSRWSTAPGTLVQQQLQQHLVQHHTVLAWGTANAPTLKLDKAPLLLLRGELLEFSQWFQAPGQSFGQVRLQASLTRLNATGEQVVAQQVFTQQRPAPTADAAGGAAALAQATYALAQDLNRWIRRHSASPD